MLLRSDFGSMQMLFAVRPNFANAASVGANTVRFAFGSATAGTRSVQLRAATSVLKLSFAIAMSAIVLDCTVAAGAAEPAAAAGPAIVPMTIRAARKPAVRRRMGVLLVTLSGCLDRITCTFHPHFERRSSADWPAPLPV